MKLEAHDPKLSSPPKPEYSKCNAGHELKLYYNPLYNRNQWDCMICYDKMQITHTQSDDHIWLKYGIAVKADTLAEGHAILKPLLEKLTEEGKIYDFDGYL